MGREGKALLANHWDIQSMHSPMEGKPLPPTPVLQVPSLSPLSNSQWCLLALLEYS